MDKFPRDKQYELLTFLCDKAPENLTLDEFHRLIELFGSKKNLYLNLWYLYENGLICDFSDHSQADDATAVDSIVPNRIRITKDGVDFLCADGGLTAILNVVTVKFHNETIEKLTEIINKSDLSVADKISFVDKIKQLPADATKHLLFQLLDKCLAHVPDAIQILSSYIRSV